MVAGLRERPGARSGRPKPAQSVAQIRRMGYEKEVQRQQTNGWWARGKWTETDAGREWHPDLGLPSDVFVYLPMSAGHEREFFSDLGYLPLSEVPNKRAVLGRPSTGEFVIEPPEFDVLEEVMAVIRAQVPESIAALQAEIDDVEVQLSDSGGLMKGESQQFRKILKKLRERMDMLRDPKQFDTLTFYRAFIRERQVILKSLQKPDAARHAELQREYDQWDEHMAKLDAVAAEVPESEDEGSEGAPATASTSSSRRSTRSTVPAAES